MRWGVGACAAAVLLLSSLALSHSYGRVFPSIFVDPYGDFSNVHLPEWKAQRFGLAVGDHIAVADNDEASARPRPIGTDIDRVVRERFDQGAPTISLVADRAGSRRALDVPIRSIGYAEMWWFWGLYVCVATCILWSGLVSHRIAGRRPAANANLFLSFSAFVFLTTFFDYHTTRWLAPLFAASTVGNAAGLFAVALYFPSPLRLPRWARTLPQVGAALAAGCMSLLALDPLYHWDLHWLRMLVTDISPVPLLALAALTLWRLRYAPGSERQEILSSAWGIAAAPALIGLSFATVLVTGQAFFHIVLPFGVLAFPLAVTYALARHNILATELVVTRAQLLPPALAAAACAGGSAWAIARAQDGPTTGPMVAGALVGLAAGVGLWLLMQRSAIFSARKFRPTIEKLADELATLRDPAAIRAQLIETVAQILRVKSVEFREDDGEVLASSLSSVHKSTSLTIPLRAAGEAFGVLMVRERVSGAPFSSEDVQLAETMASFCALALRNARSLAAAEALRDLERTAGSEGQRVTMDLLGAELAHEVAYPLNYFRHFLGRLSAGRGYDESDVEIGREEVDRLSRMLGSLRSLQLPPQSLASLKLAPVADRAAALVRGLAEERGLALVVDVPADLVVRADFDRTLQLLANLLRNAVQAAQHAVHLVARVDPSEVTIDVRDDGSGVSPELQAEIFRPFVSGRPGGSGLGLAVSQRIARSFGWSLEHAREGSCTVFRIRASRSFGEPS